MKPLFLGYGDDGAPLTLTADDLETHVHGVGASRSGKSKLIEWVARELIRRDEGFILIDPHGFLYRDLLRWLTWVQPRRDLLLFDPSSEQRIVGFNPFRPGRGDISTQVDRRVSATVKAWGAKDTDATPRLERWLRCLYHTLMEQGLSIDAARYLFTWKPQAMRRALVQAVQSELIRNEWEELLSYQKPQEFTGQVESARNRLFRFIDPLQVRRVLGLSANALDLEAIIERRQILLVNLQPSDRLSDENARLLGTLLLSEIWEVGKRRMQAAGGKRPSDFFLIIDEFQKFLTPDVPAMLDEAAKYGLHLFLFHQHLSQLRARDAEACGAVMTNARIKLVFGGLSREDARTMTEAIFPGQLDLTRIKYLIEQTKFWPVVGRATVYTSGYGGGSGSGAVSSVAWNPVLQEWASSSGDTASEFASFQEGMADVPFVYPEPFVEPSSVQLYSLEETLWEMADRLMEQYQRHFMVRRPGRRTVGAVTPYVKSWHVSEARVATYVDGLLEQFLTAQEVDAELATARLALEAKCKRNLECSEEDEVTVTNTVRRRAKKRSDT